VEFVGQLKMRVRHYGFMRHDPISCTTYDCVSAPKSGLHAGRLQLIDSPIELSTSRGVPVGADRDPSETATSQMLSTYWARRGGGPISISNDIRTSGLQTIEKRSLNIQLLEQISRRHHLAMSERVPIYLMSSPDLGCYR